METINREEIHKLVEIFYQPTFKTFYVNSVNGEDFVRPIGLFVSLGITTSIKVLSEIMGVLNQKGDLYATLAEISSIKIGGQFLNTLTCTGDVERYKVNDYPESAMDRVEAEDLLQSMKNMLGPDKDLAVLKELTPRATRLQDLIEKIPQLPGGWDSQMIFEDNGEYRLFHKFVNYKREGEKEFRVGIYVEKKEND